MTSRLKENQRFQPDYGKRWSSTSFFKDPPEYWKEQGVQHLGCRHKAKQVKDKDGHITTTHTSDMTKYMENLCKGFEEKFGIKLKAASTPFIDQIGMKKIAEKDEPEARFGQFAASPRMAGLYGARSCRPDLNVAISRMARRITRWTRIDDDRLLRLLGYISSHTNLGLTSTLSTKDHDEAVLRLWPDADLAGDPTEDSRSSSGEFVELASVDGKRCWPLHWSYAKQTFTAGHTQEAEIASMYSTIWDNGFPLASLLEFLLGRPVTIEVFEDNAAAITLAKAGFPGRLRHFTRPKRIHIDI